MNRLLFIFLILMSLAPLLARAQPATMPPKTRLLTTSIRTGDTDVFWIDPVTGDAFNITKAPASKEQYPVWSPDGKTKK